MENPIAFAIGLGAMLFLGSIYRLARGLKLHLLLVHRDKLHASVEVRSAEDEVVIPITLENRRSLTWRSIREKRWQESVELVLADDQGKYADLSFSFHPWMHYLVKVAARPDAAPVKLNSRPLPAEKRIRLVDGDRLQVGNRRYSIRVTSAAAEMGS
jgi:hypothetical protein